MHPYSLSGNLLAFRGFLFLGWIVAFFSVVLRVPAEPPTFLEPLPPAVSERGDHHRTWQTVVPKLTSYGKTYYQTNEVIELQTGLHRQTPEGWVETNPRIEIVDGRGIVQGLQYSVVFPGNGAIEIILPEGNALKGNVFGVAFIDGEQSVLLAESKECAGEISGAQQNIVTFRNAFTDFEADVQFVVERGKFSQSLILKSRVPDPAAFGLSENAVLALLTEFTEFPNPQKAVRVWHGEGAVRDEQIGLGIMQFGTGRAFAAGAEADQSWLVGKTWEQLQDEAGNARTFLLEQIAWKSIRSETDKLPLQAQNGGAAIQRMARKGFVLPVRKQVQTPPRPIQMAAADTLKREHQRLGGDASPHLGGFILDYELLVTTNYFEFGPKTYFVNGQYNIVTNKWFGGAVVKYAPTNNAKITITGPILNYATNGHPIHFVGRDDHSVGEQIGTNLLNGTYATNALVIDAATAGQSSALSHLRIANALLGIQYLGGINHTLSHAQIINCQRAFEPSPAQFWLKNCLIYNASNVIAGSQVSTCRMENVTVHLASYLNAGGACSNLATNTLFVAVTNLGTWWGNHVQTTNSDTGVFQSQSFGHHYLPTDSPFRSATTTTNLSAGLYKDLKLRSTYPPALISTNLTGTNVLGPYVPRDAQTIGYHYESLDFILRGITLQGTLIATNGVGIGLEFGATNYGLRVASGDHKLISEGKPVSLNLWVRTHAIQELPTGTNSLNPALADTYVGSSPLPKLTFRFTDLPMMAGSFLFNQQNNSGAIGSIVFKDSQVRGGNIYLSPGNDGQAMKWTNSLFERVTSTIYPYTAIALSVQNCLFKEGKLSLEVNNLSGSSWTFYQNQFDKTTLYQGSNGTIEHGWNAYCIGSNRLTPHSEADLVTNFVFEAGPLGRYYQLAGSPLIDRSSKYASEVGLYHYGTVIGLAETNTILDLGLHYIVLNAQGEPEDSNTPTNGIPNYVDDADGDGIVDAGETPYTTVLVSITGPTNNASFNIGENTSLTASASAAFSTISWVEFYNGTNLLVQDTAAPFSFAWTNLPPGIHTLTARARANAGIFATSGPVTITVHGAVFVVGNTNLSASDSAIKSRLEGLKFHPLVVDDSQSSSNDANGKRLIVISKSITPANVGSKFTYHAAPLLCWADPLLDDLKMTGTTLNTDYGSTTDQDRLTFVDSLHPMATNLSGTVAVTTVGNEFSWGVAGSNAVKVARLTNFTTRFGIFGYESNALMLNLEAPSRRAGFFLGDVNIANLTTNGWSLFDAAVRWATGTNAPPNINWVAPTNSSTFVASTNISLSATASDLDSGVKKVTFYRTGVRIAQADTVAQQTNYSLMWSNAIAGNHVLSAKALDQGGLSATSAQLVVVTVLSNALFVTQSPTLNPGETNLKARIESLGFIVTAKAATNVITADAVGKTVVVISSTAAASDLTNKFTYAATPLVVWQKDLFDDLGLISTNAADFGTVSGQTQISIIDSNHPLAANLYGTVSVTTAASDFTWGVPGSNALKIATIVADATKSVIFGYERGSIMSGVGTNTLAAPARRVGFFLTSDTAVALHANGWLLFDAAIKWAVAKPCSSSIDLMLAMDVSQSLSAIDFLRSQRAASNFVNFLTPAIDRVGLISFASNSVLESALTTNLTSVQAAIMSLSIRGGTLLEPPITMCQSNLVASPAGVVRILSLLSDGEINQTPQDTHRTNALIAAKAAKDAGTRIITIGYDTNAIGLELLKGIASSVSDFYYSPDISEFSDIYAAIADDICRFDKPPSVTITNPVAEAAFLPPANVLIQASATDEHGQVTRVDFFSGANSIGVDTSAPWSFTWTNVPTGHYTLTAVALDNAGLSATSAPVNIKVTNFPPVVLMTLPTNGTFFAIPPTNVTLSATAADSDGHITNFVFFVGATPINIPVVTNGSSYSVDWWPLFSGTNVITARAMDNLGATTTSAPISFAVNHPPLISITNPINPGVAMAPNNTITIDASAADIEASGSVTQVQFFRGEISLGVDNSAPYSVVWNNAPTGTYVLAAKATDNHGATRTSTGVNITVHPTNSPPFVDAGTNQVIRLPASATLLGRATDDGLPPGSKLQIAWAKVSGPGTVTFGNSNVAGTTASFSTSGVYKLVLSASDSQFTITNDMFVVVQAANVAPSVRPGPDQTVVLAAQVPFTSSTNVSPAQFTPDSKGREFWLAFTENYRDGLAYSSPLSLTLFVTGDKDSWVNITVNSINFATNVALTANVVAAVDISTQAEMRIANQTNDLGIHVVSQEEVSVYGLSRRYQSTDAFLGLPVDTLGTNYIVLGYTNQSWYSQFAVVATRKNTLITITPTVDTPFATNGQPFAITLNAGQGFFMQATADFSGSLVSSDKPIAVFGGNFCTAINGNSCDHLTEQLMPASAWGKNFVTMPLALRVNGDVFRTLALEDETTVQSNGVAVASSLNRAQFVDFVLHHPAHISANRPILLAQFAQSSGTGGTPGDPFMQLVPPYEQFLSRYTLTTPASAFSNHYINVVCRTGVVGQVKLDGTNLLSTNFVIIGNSGFAGSQVEITNGSHQLEAPAPFGAVVYGFGDDDSYGYQGGLSLSEIANASSIVLMPSLATNEFATTRCLVTIVSDAGGRPLPGMRVDFQVTGANTQSGFAFADGNGVARLCYFGGSIGTDVVQASVGSLSASATNNWVQPFAWLAGSVSDDGLPSGLLTNVWENVSGPGLITFSPSNTVTNAQARIPQPGVFVLGLKAGDGNLTSSSNMTLTAIRNQAPLVHAGAGQAFKGETVMLDGSATDDGLPVAPLSVSWTALNSSGNVTFSNASQPQTLVSFKSPGTYNLRLGANDGDVTITSDVIITNLPETIPLVCDQTIAGTLSTLDRESVGRPGTRADFYRFTVPQGLVVIEMVSTNVDSFLSLYSSDLQLIANDDDSLQTNNAKLVCMLPHDGEFILEASSSFTNQTGAYTLRLGCGALPHVRITTPVDGTVLTNAEITSIVIDAYDADGIDYVELHIDGISIATDNLAPYETSIYFDSPGFHTLVATALDGIGDGNGKWATSAPVVIRVIVPPLTLGPTNVCAGIPGTQYTVTATLRDNSGAALAGTNIQFTITGANSASTNQLTDAAGQASLTYTGANVGYDQIVANATVSGGTTAASGGKSWARALACNQVTTGALASVDQLLYPYRTYADYFWFNAVSNDYVVISLSSTNFDTFLSVYNIGCTLLASNDDFETTDSKLGLTITNSGNYLIEVTSFQPLKTGGYSLLMECIVPAAQPEIAVFLGPTELPNYGLIEFGVTTNGTPINRVLTITNRGDRQLVVDNVSWSGDFSSTNGTYFTIASGSATNFTVRFNAATNGSHSSYIAFYNDDGDGGDGIERPFILNLAAICNAGPAPTVTLTAPATNLVIQLPTNLVLAATASAQGASITNVEFVARKGSLYYVLGYDTTAPYGMTWNNPAAGTYVLMAGARDSNGRIGISAGVNLEVKAASTNAPPVAAQDYLAVLANSTYNVLPVLDNDADPEGEIPTVTGVFDLHGGDPEVINNGQNILYIPPFGIRGGDYFRYTITDGQGGFASSVVNVRIEATDAPTVKIITPPANATLTAGTATNILAVVTPADFQGKVEFFFHDHKIDEDSTYPYSVPWIPIEDPCNCGLTAVATDVFGQFATSERVMVNINPPFGDAAPLARIANLANEIVSISGHTYSRAATIREGLFELFGDAYDTDSSPVWYKVRIFNAERELVRDVTPPPLGTNGFRLGPVNNGSLGVLDLSLIENGLYDLELTVRAGYRQSSTNVRFALESDLKIGHFSFSEQDLVLPVNGFPLTITRTYNSLNLKKADFGRSWTFTFSDVQLELDEDRQLTESLFEDEGDGTVHPSGQFFSLRVGGERNVTLTLPDGRRTTFYYYLHPVSCDSSEFKFCALPKWEAGPGVFASLRTINDVKLAVLPWSGGMKWWTDDGSSSPESYEFPGYVLTMQDGTEYRIDRESLGEKTFVSGGITGNYANVYGAGRLTEIKSRSNDKIKIGANRIDHLNPSGQLTRSVWMQRDEENRIVAINDPIAGSNGVPVVKYDYAGENLVRVHRLVNRLASNYLTTTYTYTNRTFPHYITGITDPRGVRVARNLYDDLGRLIGVIDADGRTNSFVHNLSNRWEIALNPKGHGVTNVFDMRGNITNRIDALGRTNHFRYDTNGNMLAHTDPLGNTTTYSNDARGNVLESTLPYPSGADPAKYTTRYTYDVNDNQTSVVLPTGGVITNKFDSVGNLLETRDGAGNIITTNAYDGNGLMIAEGDQFGALRFEHDALGNANRMTNSLNQVIQSGYDANGEITNLVENGVTSSFRYDAQGRDAFANYGNGITLSNSYNSQLDWNSVDGPTIGHMERRFDSQGRLSGWTTANGAKPGFAYNENGQMEYETNSIGVVTRQVYDPAGRLIAVTNLTTGASGSYAYDAAGRRIAETNALGNVTRFDYNPDGSLKSMTNAFGTNVWTYAYDTGGSCCGGSGGTTTTVTDPFGREVTDIRSPLGLPLQLITRLGTNAVTNTTVYLSGIVSSDQEGEDYPASVTDEGGRTRNFGYTTLGQLERASDLSGTTFWTNRYSSVNGALLDVVGPTRETNSFVYDELDNVKTNRFSDGNLLINYYNAENLLSSNALPSGASLHYKYDQAGRLTNRISSIGESTGFEHNGNDAVTMMTDNTGTTTNLYDPAGRLIGINFPYGASIRYELDKLDRTIAITNRASSSGTAHVTRYAYDALGNVTHMTDPFGGETTLVYDRTGRRTKRMLPNGVTTDWQYNWRDQITNIVHKTSSGTVLASATYERAPFGEPTKVTREDGSYVVLKYDAALRLTNEQHYASGGGLLETIGYGYDASGTRVLLSNNSGVLTNAVEKGYRVTAVKNQSGGATVETYGYDTGGRVNTLTRSEITLHLGYNTADQLTAVTNGANWIQYTHDAQGRRTKAVDQAGAQRRFLVAAAPGTDFEWPHLIADGTNGLRQGYVYLGDQPLLRFDSSGSSSRTYYLEDAMGSVIGLTPDAFPGTANTTRLFYDGFGTTRRTNGFAPTIPAGTGGDFRFHAAWCESATDFYHMRAREYDIRSGRFLSRDPDSGELDTPESLNPYSFTFNNAHLFSDPSGRFNLIDVQAAEAVQLFLHTLRTAAVHEGKNYAKHKILEAFTEVAVNGLKELYPPAADLIDAFKKGSDVAGTLFENNLLKLICDNAGPIKEYIWLKPAIKATGVPATDGKNCAAGKKKGKKKAAGAKGAAKPDFLLSEVAPTQLLPTQSKAILIGDIKLSGNSLYKKYVQHKDTKQLLAIANFAAEHAYTKSGVFLVMFSGEKSKLKAVKKLVQKEGSKKRALLWVLAAHKNKNYGKGK